MLYSCKYYRDDGTEYDGGIWDGTHGTKRVTFVQIVKSFFNPEWIGHHVARKNTAMTILLSENGVHAWREWTDGSYTIFPEHSEQPHIFTPIHEDTLKNFQTPVGPSRSDDWHTRILHRRV